MPASFEVETKDSTALTEIELADMVKLTSGGSAGIDEAMILKAREDWVLVTQVRENEKLVAFSFLTLERIGGTPAIIIGLLHIRRYAKRDQVLKAIHKEQYHKALMAFPDEDVLVGTRMVSPSGYLCFRGLNDIRLTPGERTTGEERMWSRRLAKRFGAEGRIDDRTFIITGEGEPVGIFDHEVLKPGAEEMYAENFASLDPSRHDLLVGFGWMMAENLVKINQAD